MHLQSLNLDTEQVSFPLSSVLLLLFSVFRGPLTLTVTLMRMTSNSTAQTMAPRSAPAPGTNGPVPAFSGDDSFRKSHTKTKVGLLPFSKMHPTCEGTRTSLPCAAAPDSSLPTRWSSFRNLCPAPEACLPCLPCLPRRGQSCLCRKCSRCSRPGLQALRLAQSHPHRSFLRH